MKLEMVQTACPIAGTAPITYNITSAGGASSPLNDLVGALFLCDAGTLNDTTAASVRWGFGATDKVNSIVITMGAQDATAGAGIRSILSTTKCVSTSNGVGALSDPQGSFNAALSNGIQLSLNPTPSVARLTNTILFSGVDHALKVGTQYFASGDTSHAQTHGLGGTPDVIIVFGSIDVPSSTNEVDGKGFFLGFWDGESTNQSSLSMHVTTGANPTDIAQYISNASVGEIINAAGTPAAHVTVTAVGSTTFTLTFNTSAGNNNMLGWVAIRGISSQMFSGNAIATLPTGTGNTALISGLAGKPQFYLALPTRMTAVNTAIATDAAGSFGCSVGCTTDHTTTFQGMNAENFKDNVATSVADHRLSKTKGLVELTNAGLTDAVATVSTWDADGVTLNYSAGAAGSFLCPVLAFGMLSDFSVPAAKGSFVYTGQSVTFSTSSTGSRYLLAAAGNYNYELAHASSDMELSADRSVYAYTGFPATLPSYSFNLVALGTIYAYSGKTVTFTVTSSPDPMLAAVGTYTYTGQDAQLNASALPPFIEFETGTYSYSGKDATLTFFNPGTFPNVVGLPYLIAQEALQTSGAVNPAALGYFGTWPITILWLTTDVASGILMEPGIVTEQFPLPFSPIVENAPILLTVTEYPLSVATPPSQAKF